MEELEKKSKGIEYWLRHFGMPEENIDNCITQITQGYGACRFLEGVSLGAEAVVEQMNKKQGFMKKKIIYSVVIVLISIVASFFHLVFMFVGGGIANCYND